MQVAELTEIISENIPSMLVDVVAGTFLCMDRDGLPHEFQFVVHTCDLPDYDSTGYDDAHSRREDDLNEQYSSVAWKLVLRFGAGNVKFNRTNPDPFF